MTSLLKRVVKTVASNAAGFYCPHCSLYSAYGAATGLMHIMYDRQYHKFKSYIKCEDCRLTTPAYEDYKDLVDAWDDYFIKQETELFGGD